MGKKSRFKKQRQQVNGSDKDVLVQERQQQLSLVEKIARYLVIAGIYLSTLTPLILLNQFYFPFVGIKSLYFMGCAQLVFFAWLLLAILNKSYRPKWNAVLIAFLLYIVAITVSSLVGVDFSHSFWSKFERMTGLLVWLHIFAFFVALFSFFKTQKDWKNFFLASVFVSGVVALFSTLESMGVSKFNLFAKSYTDIKDNVLFVGLKSLVMADRGGLTLGNTSFLGAYLMFNLFLAIYLGFTNLKLLFAKNIKIVLQALALVVFSIGLLRFYQDYRLISDNLQVFATSSNLFGNLVIAGFGLLAFILLSVGVRFFSVGVVLIMIASLYFNEARAALGGVLVGAGAILLLWLSFSDKSEKIYKKQARSLGIIALAIFILGSLALWLVKKDLIINILNVLGKFNLQGFFYLLTGLVVGLGVWLIIGSWKVSRFVKITKNIGRAILALATIVFVVCLVLLFLPNNPIHNLFGQMGGNARFVNWSIAQQGFLERPITGWGPENYILAFPKFFNSCLFIPGECGGEIWFDRAHNIIMDNLVTAGLVGSLTYLGIFIVAFVFLALAYLKYKRVSIWEFAVFTAVLISYFLQNLTVFDMATSLMMFAVILAFIAFSVQRGNTDQAGLKLVRNFPTGSLILVVGLFAICFLVFINQPIKSDGGVIKALTKEQEIASYARQLKNSNLQAQGNTLTSAQEADFVNFVITKRQEELTEMKAGLNASPMGKYQIREFFAQQFETAIREPSYGTYFTLSDRATTAIWQYSTSTFDFLEKELEKSIKESPYDYRSTLRLGSFLSLYSRLDSAKSNLVEEVMQQGIKLSPNNQQNYWTLAQYRFSLAQSLASQDKAGVEWKTKLQEAVAFAQKALEMNPRVWNSNALLIYLNRAARDLAGGAGDQSLVKKYDQAMKLAIQEAIKTNPEWAKDLAGVN